MPSAPEIFAHVCRETTIDLIFGQVSLEIVRELAKQQFANDRTQDRVTQELEPFVGGQPVVGSRRMRQRLLEEVSGWKPIADDLLTLGKWPRSSR